MGVRLREYVKRRGRGKKIDFRDDDLRSTTAGIVVSEADINNVLADIAETLLAIDNKAAKLKILNKAGETVRDAARNHPEVQAGKERTIGGRQAVSGIYKTPKLSGKLKAPPGFGVVQTHILADNLRKSLQVLSLKRTDAVFVGPKILRSRRKVFGSTEKTASGFYAQMIFGSAKAFGKRVMLSALNNVKGQVRSQITRDAKKVIDEAAKKNGLQ